MFMVTYCLCVRNFPFCQRCFWGTRSHFCFPPFLFSTSSLTFCSITFFLSLLSPYYIYSPPLLLCYLHLPHPTRPHPFPLRPRLHGDENGKTHRSIANATAKKPSVPTQYTPDCVKLHGPRWTPQSAQFPDLSTFGPVVVCGVCFYVSLTPSSSLEGYTHEKYADSYRFRPRGAGAWVTLSLCSLSDLFITALKY